MGIWERLTYYPKLAGRYISMRFCLWKFAVLSVVMLILAYRVDYLWLEAADKLVFVFISLFVFRWIDDAWSFHLDRIDHPERTYLEPGNFTGFAVMGSIVFLIYQISLFNTSKQLGLTILILFIVSTFLYLLFFKNRTVMMLIPLLKYPVFIWIMSGFSTEPEVLLVSLASFFLMLGMDIQQDNIGKHQRILVRSVMFLITALLLVHMINKFFIV